MRKVLHIDCDCFFAAVEMRENPQLRDVPIAVGGRSDRRGVISTCNYPARQFGVRSAMATALAMKKCPSLILLPGNMPLYKEVSSQVMDIIRGFGDTMEQVSVDEAYLEISPEHSAVRTAQAIREAVVQQVGITVSVGVATNKFLAKVASDWNKPDGMFAITPDDTEAFVSQLPVSRIPGIGPRTAEQLSEKGIHVCGDARQYDLMTLVRMFGRTGASLYKRCRGIDDRPLSTGRTRKSISVERTYPADLYDDDQITEAISSLWEKLVTRMEGQAFSLSELAPFVKVKFSDFHQTTLADHMLTPSPDIFRQLVLKARCRSEKGVRLIGIGGRCPQTSSEQLSLF